MSDSSGSTVKPGSTQLSVSFRKGTTADGSKLVNITSDGMNSAGILLHDFLTPSEDKFVLVAIAAESGGFYNVGDVVGYACFTRVPLGWQTTGTTLKETVKHRKVHLQLARQVLRMDEVQGVNYVVFENLEEDQKTELKGLGFEEVGGHPDWMKKKIS